MAFIVQKFFISFKNRKPDDELIVSYYKYYAG